jgi:macrolide transport system ATP-binding/permease protein
MAAGPVLELKNVSRAYPSGETVVTALDDVTLSIAAGELVAIMGASGSGKSTLMNILGCLDRATSGSYHIGTRETSSLVPDELAALRREHFGFIFQHYNLLPELTAAANIEVPAVYAGSRQKDRRTRAQALLRRLGIENREHHLPGQLSGGQQQRVSIARALMNGADVILADEPTGALDSQSGKEVLSILQALHGEGRTVVIVTHDASVAAIANRIIELRDGKVISDRTRPDGHAGATPVIADPARRQSTSLGAFANRLRQSFAMAVLALRAHQLRTLLTMLGIIIGIASVICVVALGEGSQRQVLANINNLGTNTIEVFAGGRAGDTRSSRVTTLSIDDAGELARQPYAAAVTPTVSTNGTVRFATLESNAQVNGVGEGYFDVRGAQFIMGAPFDEESVRARAQEVVIDDAARAALFPDRQDGGIGKVIFIGQVPIRVIGVIRTIQTGGFGPQNLQLFLPYTTLQTRMLGNNSLRSIMLRVVDEIGQDTAERAVTALLTQRHGSMDFNIVNADEIRQAITSTTQTLTLLIAGIAVISLIVGGIGVMNIMLVSVSERVTEIGVRMAVGARQGDILQQFLIEAVLVCVLGGLLGIAVALIFGALFSSFTTNFALVYSPMSFVVAVLCSSLIGIVFGYLPARNASRLDPVVALARA